MKTVYLDSAATTPVDSEVFLAMKPYFLTRFGNASEPHLLGQQSRRAIEEVRSTIAEFLGASGKEIVFTSCATESINLAHKGLIECLNPGSKVKPHIITSVIEHKAVLETCRHLKTLGRADVTYLSVDEFGRVNSGDVLNAIRPETCLVSIMYVNNEVGTIQPIKEIGDLVRKENKKRKERGLAKVYFHTDATQAIGHLDCRVEYLGVDLLSFTGHKFNAPKGIGALYIRAGTPVLRQQDGGGQEFGIRAGTENVPYIVGLGKAFEILKKRNETSKKLKILQEKLIYAVLNIPRTKLVGHPKERVPHISSFIIEGAEGESVVLCLSDKGIIASSGSACTSGIAGPSHVLNAMGISPELSHGSVRFSLGKDTTVDDIRYLAKVLPQIVEKLRRMSPKL